MGVDTSRCWLQLLRPTLWTSLCAMIGNLFLGMNLFYLILERLFVPNVPSQAGELWVAFWRKVLPWQLRAWRILPLDLRGILWMLPATEARVLEKAETRIVANPYRRSTSWSFTIVRKPPVSILSYWIFYDVARDQAARHWFCFTTFCFTAVQAETSSTIAPLYPGWVTTKYIRKYSTFNYMDQNNFTAQVEGWHYKSFHSTRAPETF